LGTAVPDPARAAIETIVREEWGRVLAILVGYVRDFSIAEDVLQDAVVAALQHWPTEGLPDNPGGWLLQTARRRAIDLFRRDTRFKAKQDELARMIQMEATAEEPEETIVDQRLSMMFTCCHPALEEQARVALTLRALGGLTTTEIARAFLTPEATMAQRLVRAKRKIKAANIPYRVPPAHLWPERLASVLSVVYFVFNEGYEASSGRTLTRGDLCEEAIRLGQLLVDLAPDEPEGAGLLALMLLHDSRRAARTGADGEMITLEHQDRDLWDREKIAAGENLLQTALRARRPGPYQVQAAISAIHATAESYAETDWEQIRLLYRKLGELQPSKVVQLNEAVALSFSAGPEAGLAALDRLGDPGVLERYQPFWAARADILRRAGSHEDAANAYRRALELTRNAAERSFLERRLAHVLSDDVPL
jgi:RNA polymerase sigma-70 factor (ECF subfamily)